MYETDDVLAIIDAEALERRERVYQFLRDSGQSRELRELQHRLDPVNMHIEHAKNIWHSIGPAQRRLMTLLRGGSCCVDGINKASAACLVKRGLVELRDGRVALSEHGRFVALKATDV